MTTTKKKLAGGALAFAAALMLGVVGLAQQDGPRGFGGHGPEGHGRRGPGGPGESRGPRGGGGLGPLARDLDLTDAQKAEVKKITDAFEASTQALHEQLRQAGPGGGGPFEGLKDGAFDEAAVRAAAQARANLHVELEVARARMMSQIYALLTAEQKATLAERRQQFEQRRRAHESKAGGAPGGN
jgi:periplasmic protein CpxP/Spy